jgi:hypothetical protein
MQLAASQEGFSSKKVVKLVKLVVDVLFTSSWFW